MPASGAGVTVAYIAETTKGTTPATNNFKVIRATSKNLNFKKDIIESAEVSSTRQRTDVRHGFNRVEGEIGFEFGMEFFNDFLLAALSSTAWSTPATLTGLDLSVTGFNTFTRGAGDWITSGYRPGDWIVTTGFPTAGNNGNFQVTVVTSTNLTVQATLTNEAGDADSQVAYIGKKSINGTSSISTFSYERQFLTVDTGEDIYQIFRGVAVNQFNLSARPEGLVNVTLNLLGISSDLQRFSSADTNGYSNISAGPTSGSPFSGVDSQVYVSAGAVNSTSFDVTIDNSRVLQPVLGSKTSGGTAPDVFDGTVKVSGSFTRLFTNNAALSDFENESGRLVSIRFNDLGTTHFIQFSFYNCKFTSHDMDPPANGPVLQNLGFEALETTFGTTKGCFQIQRSTTT